MPHAVARGLISIKFACPECYGDNFGTSYQGTNADDGRGGKVAVGHCNTPGCAFEWLRRDDWLHFFRVGTSGALASFAAPLAFDRFVRGELAPTVAETLHDLLEGVMTRPPTLGVVETWNGGQIRDALRWASAEVLAAHHIDGASSQARPAFIETGAGSA